MKKRLAVEIVWSELLLCGGEWKSRKEIYEELLAEGFERKYVDWYLFCLSQHQPKEDEIVKEQKAATWIPGLDIGCQVLYVTAEGREEISLVLSVVDKFIGHVKLRNFVDLVTYDCVYSASNAPNSWHWKVDG